ncbi:MAG: substrate-binding domain-containing protein [Candidatus Paceibacterota bacterium]
MWKDIHDGAKSEVDKNRDLIGEYVVLYDKEVYHDIDRVIDCYQVGVEMGADAIIGPLAPQSGPAEERLINVLRPFKGKVIAVNSGPSEKIKNALGPTLVGCAEPDEEKMGMVLAEEVFSFLKSKGIAVEVVIVPDDKPDHRGYRKREMSIIETALRYGVKSIKIVSINIDDESTFLVEPEDKAVIFGLGPMGTIFALKAKQRYPDRILAIGTMDMSDETREAILSNGIHCSVLQNPREQGIKAVQMAMKALAGDTSAYKTLHCKVRVADINTIGSIK